MAEAVCGPSNALQQFKQQTSLDRSLQQDRFTSRRHQPQGFRSANANAGLLDPDFEAFQAGRSTPPVLDHMQPYQAASRFAPPSQLPSWASDFQRMSISAQPQLKQQKSGLFPASADSSSWATGFRDQFKQSVPRASSPSPLAFQQMARYGATGYQSSFAQPSFVPETLSTKGKAPVVDAFDEAAFERAFDLAREDMMADADVQVQAQPVEAVLEQVASTTVDVQRFEEPLSQRPPATMDMDYEPLSHMEQLPAVSQELPLQESMIEQPQHDDDALAATAQELLEKVEHNQSDKFKNSQFLGLMRKLADRQVRVEGDKMVETVSPTTASPAVDIEPAPSYAHTPPPVDAASYFPDYTPVDFVPNPDADLARHKFDHWESPYE
ncbi:uncharacterized protein K489DRAFT_266151 [Dissoconium aciculare CBS 342.82]|uniref:Peroxin 20 n=1 Tax=Dissoconium aciculare CBS 342.82 TaxID=1314786 RepID=A0A6J3LZB9_9PEZI|nr:uncharacterized protein K489DRAFT_266151 [Dissoconium aciculare CBS 342.82]KAF1821120.1 hypothetical protein K489DRAFT_266151 [Dissoconium aciculare CBS 342.82]